MRVRTYKKWVGLKFGKLTVVSLSIEDTKGNHEWNCICDCGNTKITSRTYLLQSPKPSCGCINGKDPEVPFRIVVGRYKRQAKERNIEWNLKTEDAIRFMKQTCIHCGSEPSNVDSRTKQKYNGIDRLDPAKGYEKDNCRACCIKCNRAKSDMTLTEFHEWLVRTYEHSLIDRN